MNVMALHGEEVTLHMRLGWLRLGASAKEGQASVGDAAAHLRDSVMIHLNFLILVGPPPCHPIQLFAYG